MAAKPLRPRIVSYEPGDRGPIIEATVPRFPGWKLYVEYEIQDGAWIVHTCCVKPDGEHTPNGGVTALLLRALPLSALPGLFTTEFAEGLLSVSGLNRAAIKEFQRTPRPGRRGRDDRFYAEWAARYVQALAAGRHPIAGLANEHSYSASTVRDFVHKARQRGLLSETTPGKQGGVLTDKARRLLEGGG